MAQIQESRRGEKRHTKVNEKIESEGMTTENLFTGDTAGARTLVERKGAPKGKKERTVSASSRALRGMWENSAKFASTREDVICKRGKRNKDANTVSGGCPSI